MSKRVRVTIRVHKDFHKELRELARDLEKRFGFERVSDVDASAHFAKLFRHNKKRWKDMLP